MSAKTLMVQGTTSDAGKTTLVAALCRIYARKGMKVAPFKPQNMALNSAVTSCGGEIGRAQAVQAQAANVALSTDFNPILLKPQSDKNAQVIIHGKVFSSMDAQDYHDYKTVAKNAVFESHQRLEENYQRIIVEGAGSPAEINLRAGDIANMGFAEEADCPVIIIADIDKGGVFAHLVGTLELLSKTEQARVVGFVINRFRGDIKLLESGLTWLEEKTKKPVLGVVPYIHGLHIAAEDAVAEQQSVNKAKLKVIVPVTPRMSNHNDFDALRVHQEIDFQFVYASQVHKTTLPPADLIILAGSKNTRADLEFLKNQGWEKQIKQHLRYGGKLFGICGGYQMLGEKIVDNYGIEGEVGETAGLSLLPMLTNLSKEKVLTNHQGLFNFLGAEVNVSGYEIHVGKTTHLSHLTPILESCDYKQGAISEENNIAGCYLHGIFDHADAIDALALWCDVRLEQSQNLDDIQEQAIDKLADVCHKFLDLSKIEQILQEWRNS